MNVKKIFAILNGTEAKLKRLDALEAEFKKIQGLAAKAESDEDEPKDEEEETSAEDEPKDDEEKEKSKKGKKSGKSENEEDEKNESESDEEEEPSAEDEEEEEDEPSASAVFEALLGENKALRAEVKKLRGKLSSESRTREINAAATRIVTSAGHRPAVKTSVKKGAAGAKQISRAEFDAMSQKDRAGFFKSGGKISQ